MPSKPIAAFAADLHLPARGAWAGRDIHGDAEYSLIQIVDFAIKWKLQYVVFAGDVIDTVLNTPTPILVLYRQIDRLAQASIKFGYIVGQHDQHVSGQWPSAHPHSTYLHSTPFEIGGMKAYGMDYVAPPFTQTGLAAVPQGTDLLVAHQTFADASRLVSDMLPFDCALSDVPHAKFVFAGDWHRRVVADGKGLTGQGVRLIVPGSTAMQAINEPQEKFFYVATDDYQWKSVKLKTRQYREFYIMNEDQLQGFLAKLDAAFFAIETMTADCDPRIRKPIFRIIYPYELTGAKARIDKAINKRAHLFYKEPAPPLAPEILQRRVEAKLRGDGRAATLDSELHGFLERKQQKFLEPACRQLLETDEADLANTLLKMKEERLNAR